MARDGSASEPLRIESLRLEPGSHASPQDGVCVVELASILANERFSDEPDCVCVVIGAFLRSWNDRASYVDRQRLLPYATRIVGSRGDRATTRRRREICLLWSEAAGLQAGMVRRSLARLRARARLCWLLGLRSALHLNRGAGEYAARACFARHGSEAAFRLLDRLLAVGGEEEDAAIGTSASNGNGHRNGHANGVDSARLGFVHAVLRARGATDGESDDADERAPARSNGNGNGAARRSRRSTRS